MSKKGKIYNIPQEIADLQIENKACNQLAEKYTKRPFGFKKALKAQTKAIKANRAFWDKITKLYPRLHNEHLVWGDSSYTSFRYDGKKHDD